MRATVVGPGLNSSVSSTGATGALVIVMASALSVMAIGCDPGSTDRDLLVVRMAESTLRTLATTKPLPEYPEVSLDSGVGGVAVAAIETDDDGRPSVVNILEAPDTHIAEATRDALSKWVFELAEVQGREQKYRPQGTLVLYFVPTGGGRVLFPEEMQEAQAPDPASIESPGAVDEFGDDRLQELLGTSGVTIVDLRDRAAYEQGHLEGAVNIPMEEILTRAPIELSTSKMIVFDCSKTDIGFCRSITGPLAAMGFTRIGLYLPTG